MRPSSKLRAFFCFLFLILSVSSVKSAPTLVSQDAKNRPAADPFTLNAELIQSWQSWFEIRPEIKMQPGATVTAVWREQHLDLFATGTDGAVWSTWWEPNKDWQPWFIIRPEIKMQPGATVTALWEGTHLDLFVTGTDGAVWSTWWEPNKDWQPWFIIRPEIKMQPGATVTALWNHNNLQLDLFSTSSNGAVKSSFFILSTLTISNIEATQVVQDLSNSLPLVANKTTLVRVHISTNAPLNDAVDISLYGYRSGIPLANSPLKVSALAWASADRNTLSQTANFLLPNSWTDAGATVIRAIINRPNRSWFFSKEVQTEFQARRIPVYWIVPINEGTETIPSLASNNEITSQESYVRTVFPVSDIRFVRRPWQAIGTVGTGVSKEDIISRLNDYYILTAISWALSFPRLDIPDQIYGFRTTGGGLSDPTWDDSLGVAAMGFRGTSGEGTMAHELIHNLDKSDNGTWGRHVNINNTGCGAAGPDASWPYLDASINEIGIDTSQLWSNSSVVPKTTPDLMSYCTSGVLPTKWMSPYRWRSLFDAFAPNNLNHLQASQVQDYYYVSGQINKDGTGNLNSVFIQPGLSGHTSNTGQYVIEVVDNAGKVLGSRIAFDARFTNVEGEVRDVVYFNFQLPVQDTGTKIVLRRDLLVLDTIIQSANAPVISINPNPSGQWSGLQTISWEASDSDDDSDTLLYSILYSPNKGANWYPVASNLTSKSFQVDSSTLPGGNAALLRVMVTDGFNTTQDETDVPFSISNKPPIATIYSPVSGGKVISSQLVQFNGDASTLDGIALDDNNFVWSYTEISTGSPVLIGKGRRVEASLPEGIIDIGLTVTDSYGNSSTIKSRIMVIGDKSRVYLPLLAQ